MINTKLYADEGILSEKDGIIYYLKDDEGDGTIYITNKRMIIEAYDEETVISIPYEDIKVIDGKIQANIIKDRDHGKCLQLFTREYEIHLQAPGFFTKANAIHEEWLDAIIKYIQK